MRDALVAERHRRQGVGSLLMREIRVLALKQGCNRVEWTADADNHGALAFYRSLDSPVNHGKVLYRLPLP